MSMQSFHDIESLRHLCESIAKHCEYFMEHLNAASGLGVVV